MSTRVLSFLLLSIFISLIIFCCRQGGPCEEPATIYSSGIAISFKDSTGKYLYAEANPLYNKDSLKIFDPFGNNLPISSVLALVPNSVNRYYVLQFRGIYDETTDAGSFNAELCKSFTVQYKYNERDTLRVCFKSKKTKCGSVFESLKLFNKGQLLATYQNDVFAEITLVKH